MFTVIILKIALSLHLNCEEESPRLHNADIQGVS